MDYSKDIHFVDQLDAKPREKRKAQTDLIIILWVQAFNTPIAREKASWLIGKYGSTLLLWQAMEKAKAKGIKYPQAYLSKAIELKQQLAKKTEAAVENEIDLDEYIKEVERVKEYVKRLGLLPDDIDQDNSKQATNPNEGSSSGRYTQMELWS